MSGMKPMRKDRFKELKLLFFQFLIEFYNTT